MFRSQQNRHISSRSKKFYTCGAKMWHFSGRMWQKTFQVKKNIFVYESVTFFPEMWQMWRVTFLCHRKKWQMWRHSPKSETGSWEEIRVRPTLTPVAGLNLLRWKVSIPQNYSQNSQILKLCQWCQGKPSNLVKSTFLRNQDDPTMDLTELAVAMGSLLFPDQ